VRLVGDRSYREVEQTQFLPNHTTAQIGHCSFGDGYTLSPALGENLWARIAFGGALQDTEKGMLEK